MTATKIDEPQMAAKEPVGVVGDSKHLDEIRTAAEEQIARHDAKNAKNTERSERRQAAKDGPEAVAAFADVRKSEEERREAQEKAAADARERASKWIAPDAVAGRMKDVKLILHPEEKVRKMTIQMRVLGEVPDGYVMVFDENYDPEDLKQGRIAESPRFGTKNRVRVGPVDTTPDMSQKELEKGEHTHPGYFDFGPLRMNPGKYRAVVVDTDDDVLAEEMFEIVPDWDEDGRSDQVVGVHANEPAKKRKGKDAAEKTVTQNETERAAMAQAQVSRETAKAAGTEIPDLPSGDGPATKPTAAEKKALKESPEGRAQ